MDDYDEMERMFGGGGGKAANNISAKSLATEMEEDEDDFDTMIPEVWTTTPSHMV